LIMIY